MTIDEHKISTISLADFARQNNVTKRNLVATLISEGYFDNSGFPLDKHIGVYFEVETVIDFVLNKLDLVLRINITKDGQSLLLGLMSLIKEREKKRRHDLAMERITRTWTK